MPHPEHGDVSDLIRRNAVGDAAAAGELLPIVYDNLRRLAAQFLKRERPGHTLAPTALVHEAYLRLAGANLQYGDRAHFLAVAAGAMRRILTDYARTRNRFKRGSGGVRLSLDEVHQMAMEGPASFTDLDEALERLARLDARKARVVELIFFGGLTYDETAAVLNVSAVSIHRDLRMAKAWLEAELSSPPSQ